MTTPGNHEFWFNFSAYKNRFAMPDDGANDGLYWSLELGGGAVHLTALDTESPLDFARVDDRQKGWAEADLAGSSARWTIAAGHRPLYCTNHGGQDIPHGNGVLQALASPPFASLSSPHPPRHLSPDHLS
jgi:hypothetical protein